MSAIPCSTPAISAWSAGDGERAFHALQQVLDDLDWAEPEIRLRQNRLVEELRQRGIGRALAAALIEDLVARKVFRAGASFVDLKTFVRFDGYQTDTITPNRFLHTTRDRWFRHLASRQAQGRPALPSEALEDPPRQWLTLAEAERISGINRGVISRAVDAGALASNGQKGRGKRKIDAAAFTRWQLQRAQRPERTESSAHVQRLVDKHVRDRSP
jgi:hypothetical protein